jgi:signal transduction histidine kinase/ligand-binding sensor domain-containing protein
VLALESDQSGVLWIGTDSGAARLVSGRFETIRELSGKVVTSIAAPEKGRILITTEQGQAFITGTVEQALANGKPTLTFADVRPLLDQPLQSADRDRPGLLPLTSVTDWNGRLVVGSSSSSLLQIENRTTKGVQIRPPAYFIRALETDTAGNLWVGARGRKDEPALYRGENPAKLTRLDAATGTVMAIRAAGEEVWVGTDGNGVFKFSPGKKTQHFTFDGTAGGLRSDHVNAVFIDSEDVVWFGTDRGVCRFDSRAPRVETVGDNPESNFIRALYKTSSGQLLAGTNRGLFIYDNTQSVWQAVPALERNIVYSIAEDRNGRLLIGSASGFYVAQTSDGVEQQTFTRPEASSGGADSIGSIRAITPFRGTTFIASFGRGLERFDDGRPRLIWPNGGGGSREVISLAVDGDARLLIGTTKDGVFVYDGQDVKSDPLFAGLKGTAVRSIQRTDDGTLWFATSRGVFFCRPGNECAPAAPDYDVRSLQVETQTNEVWCATTGAGVLKILLDSQLGPVVSQLDVEQGLPSQNVFAVLPSGTSQEVLFGTSRGVVRYEPGHSSPTIYATRIISKRVHSPAELENGLNLEYPQNSLLFEVSAINSRTFPEQFQYAFLLLDSSGRVIKSRLSRESQFAMEGLKPGKYQVTARAFTRDLVASYPLSFEFSVAKAPFPWTSTALAILLALALLALLWAILERRRIVATSAALVEANRNLATARLDLANEAERERRRIARDLHDQTLADLRHLLLAADELPSNGNDSFDSAHFRREIESISHEVRRICEDLSPSVLQNVGFAAALEFALANAVQHAPVEQRFKYEFVCEDGVEERAKLPANVQMQIYRIAQEAINNICRHSGATVVKMVVGSSSQGEFSLTIEDDGCEFEIAEANRGKGRGLANMRARASLIDAEVSWARRETGGTVFQLKRASAPVPAEAQQ